MNGGKQPRGYTIIEVMIVLAVSGVMFLIAASFISGKQENTSFQAGVKELASQIQDTLEQVTDGQYSDVPISCTPGNTAENIPSTFQYTVSGASPTGDCTFMGKMMQFNYPDDEHYWVFTLGGLRVTSTTPPAAVTTLADANITPIWGPDPSDANLTNEQQIPESLDVIFISVKIDVLNSPANLYHSSGYNSSGGMITDQDVSGIGFIDNPGAAGGAGAQADSYASGEQYPQLVYAPIPRNTPTADAAKDMINVLVSGQPVAQVQDAQKARLCVSDGTQYAMITVGTNDLYGLDVTAQLGVDRGTCVTPLTN